LLETEIEAQVCGQDSAEYTELIANADVIVARADTIAPGVCKEDVVIADVADSNLMVCALFDNMLRAARKVAQTHSGA
jgi:hypothetical protein